MKEQSIKRIEDLGPSDFEIFPIWEFVHDLEEINDVLLRPVAKLPVEDLENRVIGMKVRLANGTDIWALTGGMELTKTGQRRPSLYLSFYWNGGCVFLIQYPVIGWQEHGPWTLAKMLGLPMEDVFPISYDISHCCVGDPDIVKGKVEAEPRPMEDVGVKPLGTDAPAETETPRPADARKQQMTREIFVGKQNSTGTCVAYFRANDAVSNFYLHGVGSGAPIAIAVHHGRLNVTHSEVDVRWSDDDETVGLYLMGEPVAGFKRVGGGWWPWLRERKAAGD